MTPVRRRGLPQCILGARQFNLPRDCRPRARARGGQTPSLTCCRRTHRGLVLVRRDEVVGLRRRDRSISKRRSPWCRSSRGSRSARAARRTCQQGNAAAGGGSMRGAAGGDDAGGGVDPEVGDDCSGRTGRPRAAARRPEEQHVHVLHLACLAGSPTSCSSS